MATKAPGGPVRHRLQVVFADGAYRGTPPSLAQRVFGWAWRVVKRSPEQQGFAVLPRMDSNEPAWLQD